MAAAMVCVLCALVMLKPQEFIPLLATFPLLYVVFALCIVIGAGSLLMGRMRVAIAPHIICAYAFFAWGALVTLVRKPDALSARGVELCVALSLFTLISVFLGTETGVKRFAWTFLGCALFATTVAVLQADGPFGCMEAAPGDWEGRGELKFDGRSCEIALDCRKDAPNPEAHYRCERVGPLGTSTFGGRVRYRGTLADPNELSLVSAMALPLALALSERNTSEEQKKRKPLFPAFRSFLRLMPALASVGLVGLMVVLSQSRMGVIVLLVVLGIAFLRRAGAWGVILGCIAFPPVLLLGGRSGAEADASAEERLQLVGEGLGMIRSSKLIGWGIGQFQDQSSIGMTAHNSYLLAASETGLVGICLFVLMLWLAIKVPLSIWTGKYAINDRLKRFAPAITTALAGACVGLFFLSWSYKEMLYMMLGASGALHQAARAQDPTFSVKLSGREVLYVCAFALGLLPTMYVFVHVAG